MKTPWNTIDTLKPVGPAINLHLKQLRYEVPLRQPTRKNMALPPELYLKSSLSLT